MTQAESTLQPAPVRVVVCGDCRDKLYRLGGVSVPGPHTVALDTRCEVHGPTGGLAAAHVLDVAPSILEVIDAENANKALAPLDGLDDPADAPIVAQLAVSVMSSPSFAPHDFGCDAVSVSVRIARRVLAAARGK